MNYKSIIKSYEDSIRITDRIVESVGRIYSINGNEYPSVTTVLGATADKTFLEEWKNRIGEEEANRITKEACDRGTSYHQLIENFFTNKKNSVTESGFSLFQQVIPFLENITPLAIELPLYSETLRIAGRTDLVGLNNKSEVCIYDWKTSRKQKTKEMITDYFLQSTIYSMMLYERTGVVAKNINVLIASDEGFPVLFKEKVNNYIKEVLSRIKQYYKTVDKMSN